MRCLTCGKPAKRHVWVEVLGSDGDIDYAVVVTHEDGSTYADDIPNGKLCGLKVPLPVQVRT
ncbi:MAG: hypothetical protein OEZ59_13990 [Deltaproteobacteria bacterium]|nr:hypothetical protein [Deltaproteobacteria bacterium]